MAHSRHQLLQVRACVGGQAVSGMAEIVEVHRRESCLFQRREPYPLPKVLAPEWMATRTGEDQRVPAPEVARQLRDTLALAGYNLGPGAQDEGDPIEIFRQAARLGEHAAITAQQLLTAYETRAIKTAQPAPGSGELIRTARQTGRTVTIVSNNSGPAIAAYLADHQLTGYSVPRPLTAS
jgi:hypothetical protein